MRGLIHEATAQAREMLDGVVGEIGKENKRLSDDEAVARYMAQHRGDARAIAAFAARFGKGETPLHAAYRYEKAMEGKLKERRGRRR